MALDRTFVAMTPQRLAGAIMQARRRVVYAAPSLSLDVAAALINVHERLDADTVAIVVDVSEGVFRIGYGVADALATLREKRIAIRHAEGLRIAFAVIDDEGFIFALPPLLVEETKGTDDQPNAVRASKDQIEQLVDAVLPPASPTSTPPEATTATAVQRAEIGQVVVPPAQIEKIEEAIKANPVENFQKSCSDRSVIKQRATESPPPSRCCQRSARSGKPSAIRRRGSGNALSAVIRSMAASFSKRAVQRWTPRSRSLRGSSKHTGRGCRSVLIRM
jgi:hypothetical protein